MAGAAMGRAEILRAGGMEYDRGDRRVGIRAIRLDTGLGSLQSVQSPTMCT